MWRPILTALATASWACAAVADPADVDIGSLTCTLGELGEALPGDSGAAGQTRDAICTFTANGGADETYAGKVQGVSISTDEKGALIWKVKSTSGAAIGPGLLEQRFATDAQKSVDQSPPLIGEVNADIALHSMADKSEGSASATEKAQPTGFVILSVELKLKATSS
jgi:Protein of unknown function (DUF992)